MPKTSRAVTASPNAAAAAATAAKRKPPHSNKTPSNKSSNKSSSTTCLWIVAYMILKAWIFVTWFLLPAYHRHGRNGDSSVGNTALKVALEEFRSMKSMLKLEDKHENAPSFNAVAKGEGTTENAHGKAIHSSIVSDKSMIEASLKVAHYLMAAMNQNTVDWDDNFSNYYQSTMQQVQDALYASTGRKSLPLTAFLEKPLPPLQDDATPRLPSRRHNQPSDLQTKIYPRAFDSCSSANIPNDFPIQKPHEDDSQNSDCPIAQDPFLPWIHDAFVNASLTEVVFVAHNQRRCHTNPKRYFDRLSRLEPQATILQSVPVQRIRDETNRGQPQEYKLTSIQEADPDAKETRFICQFHAQVLVSSDDDKGRATLQKVVAGETLSTFPYNYEHANYQKKNTFPILTRPVDAKTSDKTALHNDQVWNSVLQFACPIPQHLRPLLQLQQHPQNTDNNHPIFPTLYVDVVPIRTYPRLDRAGYFDRTTRNMSSDDVVFDSAQEWGDDYILPPIEASGRWVNIPLCTYFSSNDGSSNDNAKKSTPHNNKNEKAPSHGDNHKSMEQSPPHFLVACVWASASFTTRGTHDPDTSTSERLLEWMTYQLEMAGFDHIYIYDNSDSNNLDNNQNNMTLEPVTSLFPTSQVTRIPWKHPVCNNNRPGHINPGERSSQYTAETSCRLRYGHTTKWMAVFDTDEYFVVQPPYTSVKQWLQQEDDDETKIWSFYQTRALPNVHYMDPVPSADKSDRQAMWQKRPENTTTFMETYNCDRFGFPKPSWSWRAQKQIFQPTHVLFHFVHYSVVTRQLLLDPNERSGHFKDHCPREKRVDENTQAFMLHTKTTKPSSTEAWKWQCRAGQTKKKKDDNNCPVGIAFPKGTRVKEGAANEQGMEYNCYEHEIITKDLAPKLRSLLQPRLKAYYRQRQQQQQQLSLSWGWFWFSQGMIRIQENSSPIPWNLQNRLPRFVLFCAAAAASKRGRSRAHTPLHHSAVTPVEWWWSVADGTMSSLSPVLLFSNGPIHRASVVWQAAACNGVHEDGTWPGLSWLVRPQPSSQGAATTWRKLRWPLLLLLLHDKTNNTRWSTLQSWDRLVVETFCSCLSSQPRMHAWE